MKALEIDFIIDTLETAIEWAEYADEYFQKKHGLAQDKENVLKSIEMLKTLKHNYEAQEIIIRDKTAMIEAMAQPKIFSDTSCARCKNVNDCSLCENVKHDHGMKLKEMSFFCFEPK